MLFEYLNWKKVPISGQAEKLAIISRIMELWSLAEPQQVAHAMQTTTEDACNTNLTDVAISTSPEMGLKFAQWFYEILLAVHKQTIPGVKISEQFWRDARLKITVVSSEISNCHEALGSDEV